MSNEGNREREVRLDELSKYFHLPEKAVAKELGICLTSLKKLCRSSRFAEFKNSHFLTYPLPQILWNYSVAFSKIEVFRENNEEGANGTRCRFYTG